MQIKLIQTEGILYQGSIIDIDMFLQNFKPVDSNGNEMPSVSRNEVTVEYSSIEVFEHCSKLLAETDWITVKSLEIGEQIPIQFKEYRAALRLITNSDNLVDINWPLKPE
jgi:hypothetical protein